MRSGKWEKTRILLVDDDVPIRSSLRVFFEAEGCEFQGVESAEKALEEVGRQHYDVIIADYRLPGMNGLEFLRKIRETHPRTKKIFTTAHVRRELFSEARQMGAIGCIEKPLTVEKIEHILSQSSGKDYVCDWGQT
jgi:two-component system response regulator (stage 0 sporulation protein F)